MNNYILHHITLCDVKLSFRNSGLVWTPQSIVMPSIQGALLQGNLHRKFSPHSENALIEQLIPTREAQTRQLMNDYILHYTNCRDMKLPFEESGPHRILFCCSYQDSFCSKISTQNFARTLRLLKWSN